MHRSRLLPSLALAAATLGCQRSPAPAARADRNSDILATQPARLPTGTRLDPAAPQFDVGQLPLGIAVSPDSTRVVLLLSGYREQGIQVVNRGSGQVEQTLIQPAAFVGIAFAPDGRELYASGGNEDAVYRYAWSDGRATLRDRLVLAPKPARGGGQRYPAGLAVSPDGRRLYVAENLADSLAVVDLESGRVMQRLPTGRYPYGVVVGRDGTVYVSAWGDYTVSIFTPSSAGALAEAGTLRVARHPSALLLNRTGTRLFVVSGSTDQVAVVDTRRRLVITRLLDPPPAGPDEGTTPNAVALSDDETRLFVAEADANAIGVFDLSPATADLAAARGDDRLAGRIPTGWYPTAVLALHDTLVVASGKGRGSRPNPNGPQPIASRTQRGAPGSGYTLAQLSGTLSIAPLARTAGDALREFSARVSRANGWDSATVAQRRQRRYPPFQHVVYIIKENRTYDQVLGDLRQGDGDTTLLFFPRSVSPNHHALAERFGLFDRFFTNAEVSADGHNWSMAAYATDYLEKTVQSNYSGRGRTYDYEGTNGGYGLAHVPEDDVAEPASGYLWNLAQRRGITFRNYGEFVLPSGNDADDPLPAGYRGNKPFLYAHTNPRYPGFDLDIRDTLRARVWTDELQEYVRRGSMPALEIVRLPNDHTSGAAAGKPTPFAAFADNDWALGQIVEALSRSPFWRSTVVFVLEDDAQNGPDHVDAHRSPLLVISAYNRPGTVHRFANTTDVLRTIEEILGLESLAQFDHYGRPLRDIWADSPDLAPYQAIRPAVSLEETNPRGTRGARESEKLNLRIEDASDDDTFNRILWRAIKGETVPYPGARRMSSREARN
ncbi:MAG TPA: bifunctional YncE family protein/alkaline phosphatase family protein [Gemmatimonadaceae bacterium]|nr:bifunctional YncE family protein/alkaline phosphatase family protein [Gemmatimonadaceae bacterium]